MTGAGFPHSETHGSQLGRQLPVAYRSPLRPSSAPGAKASTVRPYQLTRKDARVHCPDHKRHTHTPPDPGQQTRPPGATSPTHTTTPTSTHHHTTHTPAPTTPPPHKRTTGRQDDKNTGQRDDEHQQTSVLSGNPTAHQMSPTRQPPPHSENHPAHNNPKATTGKQGERSTHEHHPDHQPPHTQALTGGSSHQIQHGPCTPTGIHRPGGARSSLERR